MADNLKITEQNIDAAIDPSAGIGGILASEHNTVLKEVLNKAGKYAGIFFTAKGDNTGVAPIGTLLFNGNAFNTLTDFTIRLSKQSADLNDVGDILAIMSTGSIIHFKDKVGRSAFFEYQSHAPGNDGTNDIYDVTVRGVAGNANYTYQVVEAEVCALNFFILGGAGIIPEYTLDINANNVRLLKDGVVVSTEDLSIYIDDTNLARLVDGDLDGATGIATFERDDNTTFTVDFSSFLNGAGLTDGDYGDITVSGSGTVMTIDDGTISTSKIQSGAVGNTQIADGSISKEKLKGINAPTDGQMVVWRNIGDRFEFQDVPDVNGFLALTGGSMTGDVDFDENTLENLGVVESQAFDIKSGAGGANWKIARGVFGGGVLEIVSPTSTSATGYRFAENGIPAHPRDLITKEFADANYAGGGGSATKYNQTFVVADWTANQITIPAATHGVGTKPITQVFDSAGNEVVIDKNRSASGDVTLTVIPGQEFDGDLTII